MSTAASPVRVDVEPGSATVVFLRPSSYGRAARFFVVDGDGQYLGDMQGREYFAHKFAPGSYKFLAWAENAEMLQAELSPGRIYYVLLSVRIGVWTARMSISALTPQRQEWASLGKWMEASRQLVADVERARAWQESHQDDIQNRIRDAQGVWDEMNEAKRALRRLRSEDGFDSPQH